MEDGFLCRWRVERSHVLQSVPSAIKYRLFQEMLIRDEHSHSPIKSSNNLEGIAARVVLRFLTF